MNLKYNIIALAIGLLIGAFLPFKCDKRNDDRHGDVKEQEAKLRAANEVLLIQNNNLLISVDSLKFGIDSIAKEKDRIKYIYSVKYEKINHYTSSELVLAFDSIFDKYGIR